MLLGQENEIAKTYGNQITPRNLKEYLSIIASDALEGRKTGTRGQKMAAALIADFYREIGLTPPVNGGYYQPFELYSSSVENAYVKIGESSYDNYGDVTYFGSEETLGEVPQDIVFVGRGKEEDYKQVDVSNKAVVVLIPVLKGPLSATFRSLSQTARDKGAAVVFILTEGIPEDYRSMADRIRAYTSAGRLSLKKPGSESLSGGVFVINPPVVEKIFNISLDKLKKAAGNAAREPDRVKPVKK